MSITNYSNLKFIPTWKIQAILESPNCTGIDGADYGPVKHELESILWARQERVAGWEAKKRELGLDAAIASYRVVTRDLRPQLLVDIPSMPFEIFDNGPETAEVDGREYIVNKNGFSLVAIPPVMLPF